VGLRGHPVGDTQLLQGAALLPAHRRAGDRKHRGVLQGPEKTGERRRTHLIHIYTLTFKSLGSPRQFGVFHEKRLTLLFIKLIAK